MMKFMRLVVLSEANFCMNGIYSLIHMSKQIKIANWAISPTEGEERIITILSVIAEHLLITYENLGHEIFLKKTSITEKILKTYSAVTMVINPLSLKKSFTYM